MNASILRRLGALAIIMVTSPRSVDAAAPSGRYVVTNGGTSNGTVYDSKTKLTWQQTVPWTALYAWADAKTYCAGVGSSLGGTGWRLPTLKELQSLVDYSQMTPPRIDSTAFHGAFSDWFWSASPAAGSSSYAWYVDFYNGYTNAYDVSVAMNVRCVR